MFKELVQRLKASLASVTLDAAKKAEIEAQIVELEKVPEPTPAPTPTGTQSAELQAVLTRLEASDKRNKELFDALAAERTARENSQKAIDEQLKKDGEKKITDKIAEGKKAGRITPAQEAKFKSLLEKDFDNAVAIIDALPVDPAAKAAANKADGTGDGKGKESEGKEGQQFGLGKQGSPMLKAILKEAQVEENTN